jgi:hypothetical protein
MNEWRRMRLILNIILFIILLNENNFKFKIQNNSATINIWIQRISKRLNYKKKKGAAAFDINIFI